MHGRWGITGSKVSDQTPIQQSKCKLYLKPNETWFNQNTHPLKSGVTYHGKGQGRLRKGLGSRGFTGPHAAGWMRSLHPKRLVTLNQVCGTRRSWQQLSPSRGKKYPNDINRKIDNRGRQKVSHLPKSSRLIVTNDPRFQRFPVRTAVLESIPNNRA